jgi:putative transposase
MRMDDLSAIPPSSREAALHRFELLRPHLEEDRPLRSVAFEASIPYRTALRWVGGYRRNGLAALVRKSRTDQGGRRLASQTLIQAIEGLALERPLLPMSIWRRGDPHWQLCGIPDVLYADNGTDFRSKYNNNSLT